MSSLRSLAPAALCLAACADPGATQEEMGRPPDVRILAPTEGRVVAAGDPLDFIGEASDPYEGPLSGEKLVWQSDLEGALGVGAAFVRAMNIPGQHEITLTATDSEDLSAKARVRITVTNAAPQVEILSPADGEHVHVSARVVFEGRATDREDLSFPDSSFVWRSSRDGQLGVGPRLEKGGLSVGEHAITLTVSDRVGAVGSARVALHVVDRPPPTCAIDSPAPGATVAAGESVTLTGHCTSGDETSALPAEALRWTRVGPPDEDLGAGSSISASFPEGSHTILLCGVDPGSGLAGCVSLILVVSPNSAPVCTITSPAPGQSVDADEVVTFSAVCADAEDGPLPSGVVRWTSSRSSTPLGNAATLRVRVPYSGTQVITATATDSVGVEGKATVTLHVLSPVARILEPADGASFSAGQAVSLRGLGFDAEEEQLGDGFLEWRDNGALLAYGAQPAPRTFPAGAHQLKLIVRDSTGASAEATVGFTVAANTPPTVTIAAPLAGRYEACAPIPLGCAATDPEDGPIPAARVRWVVGALTLGDGSKTSWVPTFSGPLTLTCVARDARDQEGQASVEVTVASPVARISAPLPGAVMDAALPVQFVGQGCDAEEGTGVSHTWYLDGALTPASAQASFTTSLGAGPHLAKLVVRDGGGDEAATEVRFRLSRPPAVTITSPSNGASVASGSPLNATGSAVDFAGTDVAQAGRWRDSVQGPVGSGALATFVPVAGKHTLAFSAEDSDGLVGVARVGFTAGGDPAVRVALSSGGCGFADDTSGGPTGMVGGFALAANGSDVWIAVANDSFPVNHWSASAGNFRCTRNGGWTGEDLVGEARAILRGTDGAIWVSTIGAARRCAVDGSGRKLVGCAPIGSAPESCDGGLALALLADGRVLLGAERCLLFATAGGGASTAYSTLDGLAGPRVPGVAAAGNVGWIATSGGLCRMTPPATGTSGARFDCYSRGSTGGALPSDQVNAVAVAPSGAVWVGTEAGLSRLSPESGIWLGPLTAGTGHLPDDRVRGLVVTTPSIDGSVREVVWAATAGGLARIDGGRLDATRIQFDPGGAPGWDALGAAFSHAGGDKWFATPQGIAKYTAP